MKTAIVSFVLAIAFFLFGAFTVIYNLKPILAEDVIYIDIAKHRFIYDYQTPQDTVDYAGLWRVEPIEK